MKVFDIFDVRLGYYYLLTILTTMSDICVGIGWVIINCLRNGF